MISLGLKESKGTTLCKNDARIVVYLFQYLTNKN